jgi:predicted transcriptional regulator
MKLTVADLMRPQILSVGPETEFKDLVGLLDAQGMGALPVIDKERRVIGVVSQGDLLLKECQGRPSLRQLSHLFHWLWQRRKAVGHTAARLMTSPAVTIRLDASPRRAAAVMRDRDLRQLPVLDCHGHLAGMLSRGDLLTVFLRTDEEILADMKRLLLASGFCSVQARVQRGLLQLWGQVEHRAQGRQLAQMAWSVDGVIGVQNRVHAREDDLRVAAAGWWGALP